MNYSGLFKGIGIILALLVIAASARAAIDLTAGPSTNVMPISWKQAYSRIIVSPDEAELEKGEILFDMKKLDDGTILAQSMGLIEATPEESERIAGDYNHYTSTMPYTVEGKIVRIFRLAGEYAGAEAVDFWARVSVLGFQTRYLIRVANRQMLKAMYTGLSGRWCEVRPRTQVVKTLVGGLVKMILISTLAQVNSNRTMATPTAPCTHIP